jgi:DJ-1/PfpI family protein
MARIAILLASDFEDSEFTVRAPSQRRTRDHDRRQQGRGDAPGENAGARWLDREVVEDGSLITSRKPEDLEAFSRAIVRRLEAEGAHAGP